MDLPLGQRPVVPACFQDGVDGVEHGLLGLADGGAMFAADDSDCLHLDARLLFAVFDQHAIGLLGVYRDDLFAGDLIEGLHALAIAFTQHRQELGVGTSDVFDAAGDDGQAGQPTGHMPAVATENEVVRVITMGSRSPCCRMLWASVTMSGSLDETGR